jgi:hypothetical protein
LETAATASLLTWTSATFETGTHLFYLFQANLKKRYAERGKGGREAAARGASSGSFPHIRGRGQPGLPDPAGTSGGRKRKEMGVAILEAKLHWGQTGLDAYSTVPPSPAHSAIPLSFVLT